VHSLVFQLSQSARLEAWPNPLPPAAIAGRQASRARRRSSALRESRPPGVWRYAASLAGLGKGVISDLTRALLVAVLVLAPAVRPSGAGPLDPELERVVETLALQFSDGIATFIGGEAEQGEKGTLLEGKIVVLFGLTSWGGGNSSRQFLAVFERHDELFEGPNGRRIKPYQLLAVVQVGDDFYRWFKTIELRQDLMILRGRSWLKADPHCCPSEDTAATYRLSQRGLVESGP
jgi:hypothetical protein